MPDDVLDLLVAWQSRALGDAAGRIVPRANLHITLAFLGSRPAEEAPAISGALREAANAIEPPVLAASGYRETRSVAMLVLSDDGRRAGRLAGRLHRRLERLGVYRREQRPWLPHVTVLRFRERPRLRPELPELAAFSPSDAALYTSLLRPGGAQYEVLETAALGGG